MNINSAWPPRIQNEYQGTRWCHGADMRPAGHTCVENRRGWGTAAEPRRDDTHVRLASVCAEEEEDGVSICIFV